MTQPSRNKSLNKQYCPFWRRKCLWNPSFWVLFLSLSCLNNRVFHLSLSPWVCSPCLPGPWLSCLVAETIVFAGGFWAPCIPALPCCFTVSCWSCSEFFPKKREFCSHGLFELEGTSETLWVFLKSPMQPQPLLMGQSRAATSVSMFCGWDASRGGRPSLAGRASDVEVSGFPRAHFVSLRL